MGELSYERSIQDKSDADTGNGFYETANSGAGAIGIRAKADGGNPSSARVATPHDY
jgi:hypothetical protein